MKKTLLLTILFCFSLQSFSQNSIVISGVISPELYQNANIYAVNSFPYSEFNSHLKTRVGFNRQQDTFSLTYRVSRPQCVYLALGYMKFTPIYITPGDKVWFTVSPGAEGSKYYTVRFTGTHAAQYNFFFDLQSDPSIPETPRFREGDDVVTYKQTLDDIKARKLAFLENYKQQYTLSEDFTGYARAKILNDYNYDLVKPLEFTPGGLLPDGYFDDCVPVIHPTHTFSVSVLYTYFRDLATGKPTGYQQKFDTIIKNFGGYDREFLLCALTGLFAERARGAEEQAAIARGLKEAEQYVQDSVCQDYLRRTSDFFHLINKPFPAEVLDKTRVKRYPDGREITLREMLSSYEGKALYLDFWASWCWVCIENIQASAGAKAYLAGKGVEVIYLDVLDTPEKWEGAVKRLDIGKNQYFVFGKDAPLVRYLQLLGIPKYVLMDKEHKIKDCNAPRPVPEQQDDLQRAVMQLNPKIIRF